MCINSVKSYAYDAADVMDDDNFTTVLDSYVTTSPLQAAKVSAMKVSRLDHLVLAKRWGISPQKTLNTIRQTTQHGVCTVLHPSVSRWFRTNDCQSWYRRLPHNVYIDALFVTTVSRRGNRCAQIFATDFGWSRLFLMRLKSEAIKHCPFYFSGMGCHLQ